MRFTGASLLLLNLALAPLVTVAQTDQKSIDQLCDRISNLATSQFPASMNIAKAAVDNDPEKWQAKLKEECKKQAQESFKQPGNVRQQSRDIGSAGTES
ncbi:hypothetical protein AJ79_07075 [Helicocarpus griseus UAMH5409]|uniref:Uncharacterized protein n=1 Tax=Helicocarpus griseus UAMH5409 TaxID=1447875 RepID=A0A2B7X6M1_9EURO|nr:hypothetical protein AJ79_07075 [Helicocarpus griseus UAMH5409]